MHDGNQRSTWIGGVMAAAIIILAGCASVPSTLVEAPYVSLNRVEVQRLDLDSQTVLLGFDVTNPNPFPLPVRALSYGVRLDGYRFASGETSGDFTVPAQSDSAFAISVELDLLTTAPGLINIVTDGAHRDIPYDLAGEFDVDVPFAPPVPFETSGTIRLFAGR
jgi:LEA14-like dessication related protein